MEINLAGRNAVVCGSTQGIGKAVAVQLAKCGASVTLIARNEESLKVAVSELNQHGSQTHQYICADFSKPDELRSGITNYIENNPAAHILVNNTGGPAPGAIFEAETTKFEEAFTKHILCNQILVQALVPGMKSEKYGRIINIISSSVKQPIPGLGVSNTIRGAVASWAKTLAGELAPHDITVNNILPGYVSTNRLKTLFENKAARTGKSIQEIEIENIDKIPAKRLGDAAEIAFAVAFLASPFSAYITGVSLPVDGGRILCL